MMAGSLFTSTGVARAMHWMIALFALQGLVMPGCAGSPTCCGWVPPRRRPGGQSPRATCAAGSSCGTSASECGRNLSAGQSQLIALARAQLADPAILLLDEATAALDLADEAAVNRAISELTAARTTIVVAHRLSTAARADRIVVLDSSRIAETGNHDELLAADGTYAALWDAFTGESEGPRFGLIPKPPPEPRSYKPPCMSSRAGASAQGDAHPGISREGYAGCRVVVCCQVAPQAI
jgi:ABC-type dipeptide/oligopeptide/nickel transport system ATPase component